MLARLLVLVNVFLSVGLLAWALTLSSNRLDWVDAKTDTGTAKGQITLLKEEIDRAAKGAADLSGAYVTRGQSLAATEANQSSRKKGYETRLKEARGGQFLKQLPLDGADAGFTNLSKVGPAEEGPDKKPLRGLAVIQADIDRELKAAERAVVGDAPLAETPEGGLDAALADDARYTELTAKLGTSDSRKLQEQISQRMAAADVAVLKQKEIRVNLTDEAAQLQAGRVNWKAQLQDLLDRQGQLGRRLTGLQGK